LLVLLLHVEVLCEDLLVRAVALGADGCDGVVVLQLDGCSGALPPLIALRGPLGGRLCR